MEAMRLALVALLAGCSFQAKSAATGSPDGPTTHDGPKIIDAAIDSPPDAFDDKCFGGGPFYVCLTGVPSGQQMLPDPTNTSNCTGTGFQTAMMGTTPVCVFAGASVSTDDTNVTGNKPLVVIATGDIDQSGYIDASSANGRGDGPGANDASCTTVTNNGGNNAGGAGGGAGGSFGTRGAMGGGGGGANGGTAGPVVPPPVTKLRGGCAGGSGGNGGGGLPTGGSGGGAVMFIARGTIHLDGTIDVSGAGGDGGHQTKGGGGGGGSGGMIVLHGIVSATTNAILFANGGGGGGGAGQGTDGLTGGDAMAYDTPASGAQSNSGGSSTGGNGATQNVPPTAPGTAGNGGGGGGGGLGVIRLLGGASLQNAHYSPAPS